VLLPRASAVAAVGAVRPWPAVLVTWGPGGESALHAHHCWHLLVGLDADLSVRTSVAARARRAGAVLTAPDALHAVDARGTRAAVVFVAPESDTGERLRAGSRSPVRLYSAEEANEVRELLSPERLAREPDEPVSRALFLGGDVPAALRARHPGVLRVLRQLRDAPPDADASLAALADRAGLSPGRFMHAFTETVGIPLRPYLRWLKLERAGAALAAGASLGEAAYLAGFADAAHMTRTFRSMFGVTPSDVRRRSQSVQDR
jgi:AraC-like DNA-binding protein